MKFFNYFLLICLSISCKYLPKEISSDSYKSNINLEDLEFTSYPFFINDDENIENGKELDEFVGQLNTELNKRFKNIEFTDKTTIYVDLNITKRGNLIIAKNDLDTDLYNQLTKAIDSFPKISPAKIKDEKSDMKFKLPIVFN